MKKIGISNLSEGFSLIELSIAVGLLGLIFTGVAKLMQVQSQAMSKQAGTAEFQKFRQMVETKLSKSNLCKPSGAESVVRLKEPLPSGTIPANHEVKIALDPGVGTYLESGMAAHPSFPGLTFSKISLAKIVDHGVVSGNRIVTANLSVSALRKDEKQARTFNVSTFSIALPVGTNNIAACGTNDGPYQAPTNALPSSLKWVDIGQRISGPGAYLSSQANGASGNTPNGGPGILNLGGIRQPSQYIGNCYSSGYSPPFSLGGACRTLGTRCALFKEVSNMVTANWGVIECQKQ